jgi:hypothetical protein
MDDGTGHLSVSRRDMGAASVEKVIWVIRRGHEFWFICRGKIERQKCSWRNLMPPSVCRLGTKSLAEQHKNWRFESFFYVFSDLNKKETTYWTPQRREVGRGCIISLLKQNELQCAEKKTANYPRANKFKVCQSAGKVMAFLFLRT